MSITKPASKLKEDCKIGSHVFLTFTNGETYDGYYKGINGNDIMLRSVSSKTVLGFPFNQLLCYQELLTN